ncbi:MAG: Acyl-CoA thioesterase [Humibacillus sp.]|nr:Acyl-CoA thioesterase [Humibacillus sp.]
MVHPTTEDLTPEDGVIVRASRSGCATGVLVLSGSSGRVERERAAVLSARGVTALTYRWFGAPGQPHGIWELPLESFGWAVERLAAECDRVVLLGTSKSAEAFLLYAADDPRVDAVVALSPTHVAWGNVSPAPDGALRPQHSSWSRGGEPVPFVPYDDEVEVRGDPPVYAPVYRASLLTDADHLAAASIPVERLFGDVLLVAGGDDQLWPSLDSARALEARRAAYALPTTLVTLPEAGHRVVLPGESVQRGGAAMARGGTEAADRELGRLAWPEILRVLEVG